MNPDEVQTALESMAEELEEFWDAIVPHLVRTTHDQADVFHGRLVTMVGELHHLADWVAHEFVEAEAEEGKV